MAAQSTPEQEDELRFTVLENGLDFLLAAINFLSGQPTARQLKHGVLNLSAGLLLILKDRLRREHWALVFADVNKAEDRAYRNGDFVSVDFNGCLKRLADICGVEVADADRRAITSLKARRNRLEHFATVDSGSAIKALAAKVLAFAMDFISTQYDRADLEGFEASLLVDIRLRLPEFEHFVEERSAMISADLAEAASPILECPSCLQEAAIIDDGFSCRFCGYSGEPDLAAADYVKSLFGLGWKHVADGGELHIHQCPECWGESLVDIGTLKEDYRDPRMICFACGVSWGWDEIDFCARCGNPMRRDKDGLSICPECFGAE